MAPRCRARLCDRDMRYANMARTKRRPSTGAEPALLRSRSRRFERLPRHLASAPTAPYCSQQLGRPLFGGSLAVCKRLSLFNTERSRRRAPLPALLRLLGRHAADTARSTQLIGVEPERFASKRRTVTWPCKFEGFDEVASKWQMSDCSRWPQRRRALTTSVRTGQFSFKRPCAC